MPKQLPKATLDYLEYGAQEGERNAEVFKHACQFRDAGFSYSEAVDRIGSRAVADGLLEAEGRRSIESAYQGAARDAITARSQDKRERPQKPQPKKKQKTAKKVEPKTLPSEIPDGAETLIRTCFQPGDWIAIGDTFEDEDGNNKPGGGTTYEYSVLLKAIKERGISKIQGNHDVFIRVNPVIEDGKANRDVTAFRHVLVEFDRDGDGNPIPRDLQYGAILDSGMPVAALIDSGNKSIHAWIRVEAENEDEYKERVQKVWDHFSHQNIDPQNRNSSRYSRCPGVKRTIKDKDGKFLEWGQQKLLAVNFGAESWEEWEVENLDGLPGILTLLQLTDKDIAAPKQIIQGFLNKGRKMVLGGPSKSRKSWMMIDLMLSVGSGGKWMGMQCVRGKVLYINLELAEYAFRERLCQIAMPKLQSNSELVQDVFGEWCEVWNLRGHSADISTLVDRVIRRIQKRSYDMVIVDPIYKTLGHLDENKAGDMTEFLGHVERLSETTGAAVVIAAHYAKGKAAEKQVFDRISGSGVFVRDPDAIVMVTPEPVKGNPIERFAVNSILREFATPEPFHIKWVHPLMQIDDTVYAKESKETAPRAKGHQSSDLIALIPEGGIRATAWSLECRDKLGISDKTFYRYLSQMKESNEVHQDMSGAYKSSII